MKKRFKKLTISTLLSVMLLSFGGSSAFAGWGWGDTMSEAITIYSPYQGVSSVYVPIDSPNDNDWYVIDNSGGSQFGFSLILTPPSGINLDMQLVTVEGNGNITKVRTLDHNGPGYAEAIGMGIQANEKIYVRVYSHGSNDYDSNRGYQLKLNKQ